MKPSNNKAIKATVATETKVKLSFKERVSKLWQNTWNLLFHEDVYYRIGGYLIFGIVLFLATWAIFAFLVKKQNLLFDSFMVQKFFKPQIIKTIGPWGAKTFGKYWYLFGRDIDVAQTFAVWGNVLWLTLKYFLNHLVFVFLFIFCLNLFKVGRWSLSAIYLGFYTMLWAGAIGTNSTLFPTGNNQVLGSLIIFARYGLWNWFSYILLAISTSQFSWLVAPKWTEWAWEKQRKFWPVSFNRDQAEVFIYGLLFLLASSFAEARIFVHYNI